MIDYAAAANRCRTENQFNRLHIDLERILTPMEMRGLYDLAATTDLPRLSRRWLKKTSFKCPELPTAPQAFLRQPLFGAIDLFDDPDVSSRDKTLLFAFTGDAKRMMMPLPIFLQALDARRFSVVLFTKDERRSYLKGFAGVAGDLAGLVRAAADAAGHDSFSELATIGCSSGGYAAVVAALELRAARGVSIGGIPPTDGNGQANTHAAADVDLRLVFGAEHNEDRENAVIMRATFGGRLVPIAGTGEHNIFRPILRAAAVKPFLNELLAVEAPV
jgi:hypothetical protein